MVDAGSHGTNPLVMLTEAQADAARELLEKAAAEGLFLDDPRPLAGDYRLARQVLDRASVGIAVLDGSLRYRYVNEALAAFNGVPAEGHLGRRIAEVIPTINVDEAEAALRAVLADGRPRAITVEGTAASDGSGRLRWWHNAYHRVGSGSGPAGVVAMVLEITQDRRIMQALHRARTRLALLDQAATRIGTTLDAQKTCEELANLLVPRLADLVTVDVLDLERLPGPDGPVRLRRLALSAVPALREAGALFGAQGAVVTAQPSSGVWRCLDEQRPVVSNFPDDVELRSLARRAGLVDGFRELALQSVCYLPLTAGVEVIGAVLLVRTDATAGFSAQDVELAAELVARAAGSIDNARRYAEQRDAAMLLQRALLSTRTVPHPDVECVGRYLPSGAGAEVGGDWFDSIALPDGTTALVVGDVMGHGLEAAASMAEYRSTVRTLVFQGLPPEEVLGQADRIAQALDLERMATCLVAVVDPRTRTAVCGSAGHLPPLLISRQEGNLLLDLPVGAPLGAGTGSYDARTLALPEGSALLLYTDGLVERRAEDIETRLRALADLSLDAAAPLERLLDKVLSRLATELVDDDVALLVARVR
ncbi:SpoIIE family protein phosphatase [Kitasatospora albolonga]|uniref:SpoIIE family protein phosphatase n=1 Tax=Kitasatospora albolonga TaxID=68173 RepID=UPI0035E5C93E